MHRVAIRACTTLPSFQHRSPASRATSTSTASAMSSTVAPEAKQVLDYWFSPDWATTANKFAYPAGAKVQMWWKGGEAVDTDIRENFQGLHQQMESGALDGWINHPLNTLAGIILIDQMSRNMFRGTPKAFALDSKALAWAKQCWANGSTATLPVIVQTFLVLPLMHSEVLADQEECIARAKSLKAEVEAARDEHPDAPTVAQYLQGTVTAAEDHRDLIAKWGRFPHRNGILGRESTPEEAAGIADGSIKRF